MKTICLNSCLNTNELNLIFTSVQQMFSDSPLWARAMLDAGCATLEQGHDLPLAHSLDTLCVSQGE